jgi:hypothetical protein
MNAFVLFPAHLHWTSQQLAEAVPLRLHEMFAFDAGLQADAAGEAQPQPRRDYAPRPPMPERFSVR